MKYRLVVNPVLCDGHGLCAELLPERVALDDWSFPIISDQPFDEHLLDFAKKACSTCPVMALTIERCE